LEWPFVKCDSGQAAAFSRIGTVKVKAGSSSGSRTTQTRPPCASVFRRHTPYNPPEIPMWAELEATRRGQIRSFLSSGFQACSQMTPEPHWLVRMQDSQRHSPQGDFYGVSGGSHRYLRMRLWSAKTISRSAETVARSVQVPPHLRFFDSSEGLSLQLEPRSTRGIEQGFPIGACLASSRSLRDASIFVESAAVHQRPCAAFCRLCPSASSAASLRGGLALTQFNGATSAAAVLAPDRLSCFIISGPVTKAAGLRAWSSAARLPSSRPARGSFPGPLQPSQLLPTATRPLNCSRSVLLLANNLTRPWWS